MKSASGCVPTYIRWGHVENESPQGEAWGVDVRVDRPPGIDVHELVKYSHPVHGVDLGSELRIL